MSRRLFWATCVLGALFLSPGSAAQSPAELFSDADARTELTPEQNRRFEQYRSLRSTARIRAAQLLTEPSGATRLRLSLFPQNVYEATLQKLERRDDGSYSWQGTINGLEGGVILHVRGRQVTGWVWARHEPEGEMFFSISSLGEGKHVIRQTDQAWFDSVSPGCLTGENVRGGSPAVDREPRQSAPPLRGRAEPSAAPPGLRAAQAGAQTKAAGKAGELEKVRAAGKALVEEAVAQKAAVGCVVNVLVAYTPAAQSAHGDIPALAQLAVDQTNNTYGNSQVTGLSLNLVGTLAVNYAESGTMTANRLTDLVRLQDPADGFIDQVHAARSNLGADIVVLMANDLDSLNVFGEAFAIPATTGTAFAVVDWEAAVDNLTFGHELGHLQGARHHNDGATTPYAYGHGSCRGWPYKYRTMMGTATTCQYSRVPYWSNPDVKYNNRKTGDHTDRNNARVLRETACAMSNLVGSAPLGWNYRWGNDGGGKINWWNFGPADRYAVGDFDGDGVDELLAVNPNGWSHLMEFDGANWTTPWGNGGNGWIHWWHIGNNDRFVAGDFIAGNGRDELLAVNHAGGYAHLLTYNGSGWVTPWVNGGNDKINWWYLNGTDRYAVGDFDGDSVDDLLAVNPNGSAHLMKYNGTAWATPWVNSNGTIHWWSIGGSDRFVAGDFITGNGRDEVLAVNPAGGYAHLLSYGGGNWATPWVNGGSGWIHWWSIAGTDHYVPGDYITGDGRDEVLAVATNNGWSQLLSYPASNWQTVWANNGAGNIGWWLIGSPDRYLSGKFVPGEQRDDLLSIQPYNGWAHLHSR